MSKPDLTEYLPAKQDNFLVKKNIWSNVYLATSFFVFNVVCIYSLVIIGNNSLALFAIVLLMEAFFGIVFIFLLRCCFMPEESSLLLNSEGITFKAMFKNVLYKWSDIQRLSFCGGAVVQSVPLVKIQIYSHKEFFLPLSGYNIPPKDLYDLIQYWYQYHCKSSTLKSGL